MESKNKKVGDDFKNGQEILVQKKFIGIVLYKNVGGY